MSDSTGTGFIRSRYWIGRLEADAQMDEGAVNAEFDQWLEAHDQQVYEQAVRDNI